MNQKRILIVDDEEAILTVLKNSLKKLGSNYKVVTVTDGFDALNELLEEPFDLVVTDYNMAQMDGLELIEAIRYAQPNAQVIMITAYGSDLVEDEVNRLQAFRYLTKPLEINTFRQIVQEALSDTAPTSTEQAKLLILSDEKYKELSQILEQLGREVGTRCSFLTDANGNIVTKTGYTENLAIENIATLLGGGIATLIEAGRTMDGDVDAINLAYREGKDEDLYVINVGQHYLLILIINRGPYSSRLGSVWYQARQTAVTLREKLAEVEAVAPQQMFEQGLNEAFDEEFDKLLIGNDLF